MKPGGKRWNIVRTDSIWYKVGNFLIEKNDIFGPNSVSATCTWNLALSAF